MFGVYLVLLNGVLFREFESVCVVDVIGVDIFV